jgi:hypothetical protein
MVKHYDYEWDLDPHRIVLDRELNTDKLGYKHGDVFKFTNVDGQQMLVKLDPVVKFIEEGLRNETSNLE